MPNNTKDGDLNRRRFLKAAGGTAAAGLFAGCTGDGGGGTPTPKVVEETKVVEKTKIVERTPTPPEQLSTELAVSHYPVIPDTVPFQVGMEKGIYADHDVTVEDVTSFAGGGTTVRGIVTGGIGMGGTALPALVKAYLAGAPIFVSGIVVAFPPIDFHVPPDSSIESIQDASGKTIAVSNPGSSSEAMTIASVQAADGITLDDIEIMHAGGLGEALTAMSEGKAEISWNIPPVSQQFIQGDKSKRVWKASDYAPNITELVLAVGGDVKQNKPRLARNLLAAQVETYEFVKNNVEEAASVWAANADLEEDIALQALKDVQPEKMYNIQLKQDILESTAETMIAQDLIDEQPPWKEITWQDPLPSGKQVDWLKG